MSAFSDAPEERLLRALAEQLKAPFLQIARTSELAQITEVPEALNNIEYTADMALRIIDSYLLSVRLQALPVLDLEPVSVSAVLQDTAQRLNMLARQYDCDLTIKISGKYGPVMAHRQSLEAAYVSLGYAFIESMPASERRHEVVLELHKNRSGVVAGVFANHPGLTAEMFHRAKALYGTAQQGIPSVSSTSGAGVFIADTLLKTMASPLRMTRYRSMAGLASTLMPSQQLQLV